MIRAKLILSLILAAALSCGGPSKTDTTPEGGGGGGDTAGGTGDTTTTAPELTREQIFAASDLPDTLDTPLPGDGMGVTIHRLSNGMTVYISTDRMKPRFNSWIAVRTGSRMDPADSTGLAHYLEHMLFKGTDELGTMDIEKEQPHLDRIAQLYDDLRKTDDPKEREAITQEIDSETQKCAQFAIPNELDNVYATLGVNGLNAFTSDEETVYVADVPSNRFEAWVKVEAERFRDPRFRLFYPELEAVYEEKNRTLDNTSRRIYYALMEALYPKHPYGTQPTIGLVEHLKTPAYNDMVAYFHKWYVPNNMAIILAGDIDAATAIPVLEREWGSWEPQALSKPEPGELPKVNGRQEVVVEAEGENAVTLAWQTVGINDPDQSALEVMDWLMSSGQAGLIDVELVLSQKLPKAGSNGDNFLEAGYWELRGTAREGQTHEEVEKLLLGVVDKLKSGAYSQEDIDAIVLHAEMREMQETESNRARVGKMGSAFIYHQSWDYAAKRSDRLRKVTVADVERVADKYLTGDYVVVKRVKGKHSPPKIDKPKITPIEIDPSKASAFAQGIKDMPVEPLEPEWLEEGRHYQRVKLASGGMLAAVNPRNELFRVSYRFDMGSRDQKMLCFALDLMERSGTKDLTAEELKTKLWRMGVSLNTSCSADNVTLSISGVDRNLEASVKLLDDWLRTARLEDEALKKLVENTVSQRKDRKEEPRYVGQALSGYAFRGKDSQFLLVPNNKQLEKATTKQLGALLAKLPDYQHRTSYFGPRDAQAAAKIIALGKGKPRKVRPRKPVKYRKTRGVEIFFVHKDVAQSQILTFMPKPALPQKDRPDAELYNEYLGGGMGGLIFQEIREARGLAYSAFAGHRVGQRPKDESGLLGYIGTQSDKTINALTTLLELVHNLPMQPDRLAKAKEAIDAEYRASRVDPRSVTGWVMSWDDLGLESDPRPAYWEGVKKLDEKALKAFADRFAKGNVIISIMGDRSRIDMKALAKIGKIHEVKIDDLFNY